MQLSVLLPTVRPHQIGSCIDSIHAAAAGLDYEIVVVADFEIPPAIAGKQVNWTVRTERDGPIAAICEAERIARGDYLFLLADEDRLDHGALVTLYAEAERYRANGVDVILTPWCGAKWWYYRQDYPFPPFPFVHRDVVKALGGLLDPDYGAHFADPDLGLRAWTAGVQVIHVMETNLHHNNGNCDVSRQHKAAFYDRDRATFRARWDHLGAFNEAGQ